MRDRDRDGLRDYDRERDRDRDRDKDRRFDGGSRDLDHYSSSRSRYVDREDDRRYGSSLYDDLGSRGSKYSDYRARSRSPVRDYYRYIRVRLLYHNWAFSIHFNFYLV